MMQIMLKNGRTINILDDHSNGVSKILDSLSKLNDCEDVLISFDDGKLFIKYNEIVAFYEVDENVEE